MHFFKSLLIGATTLATYAYAQGKLQFTSVPSSIQGGKSYTVKWSGGNGSPATIVLRKGPSGDLKTLATLTTSATGGSFTWNVDDGLVSGSDYALQITEGTETNYQGPLSIAAAGTPSVSTSSASKTSSTSSSTSTSSKSTSVTTKTTTKASTTTKVTTTKTSTKTSSTSSSSSSTSSTSTTTTSGGAPQDTGNAASNLKNNGALLLGAAAAVAYLA